MNNVLNILKADIRTSLIMYVKAEIMMLFFFVYFSLIGDMEVNFSMLFLFGQAMMIYMNSTQDVLCNISTYIGMGCTRKDTIAALFLRWVLLLVAGVAFNALICVVFYPNLLIAKTFIIQIASFFAVLGINNIATVIARYHRLVGTLLGCLVACAVGAVTYIIGAAGSQASAVLNGVSNETYGISFAISVIVLIAGTVFYIYKIRKYAI